MESVFGHDVALARVQALAQLAAPLAGRSAAATPTATPTTTFSSTLQSALGVGATTATAATALPPASAIPAGYALVPLAALWPGGAGTPALTGAAATLPSAVAAPSAAAQQRVAIAAGELGVEESPPGSNDGTRIATYRTATSGSGVGPWCSYFVSWVAAQAGTPLGASGAGEGYVPYMRDWLVGQGRYAPNTVTPRPGDLVLFDRNGDGTLDHIGLVEAVDANGRVHTIEGNSSDSVRRRDYDPSAIAGYGLLS